MSQQINMLNPLLRKHRDYFSFKNILQAWGVVISGSLIFYGYAYYETAQLTKQFEESTQRYNAEQARLTTFTREITPKQTKEMLQAELSGLKKELSEKTALIEALSVGGSATGFSEYMRAFSRQIVQDLWLNSFNVVGDGAEISLSGKALNPELLPVYIQRLGQEKIMQGKIFADLQIHSGDVKAQGSGSDSQPRYVEFVLRSTPGSEAKK